MERRSNERMARAGAIGLAALCLVLAPPASTIDLDDFDHWSSGFPLSGAHARTACEDCHRGGLFRGTPTDCATCHGGAGLFARSRKTPQHVPSSNRCDDCHTTVTFENARFDHMGVAGPCIACHSGVRASGKHARHLPTSNRCEDCHVALTWRNARFTHVGISSGCFACHNAVQASGKSPRHLPTSNRCEDCHDTGHWETAVFSHVGIQTGCISCHNNVLVAGKHPGHRRASDACEQCHNTTSWK